MKQTRRSRPLPAQIHHLLSNLTANLFKPKTSRDYTSKIEDPRFGWRVKFPGKLKDHVLLIVFTRKAGGGGGGNDTYQNFILHHVIIYFLQK